MNGNSPTSYLMRQKSHNIADSCEFPVTNQQDDGVDGYVMNKLGPQKLQNLRPGKAEDYDAVGLAGIEIPVLFYGQ
jgi:hypothetical protein